MSPLFNYDRDTLMPKVSVILPNYNHARHLPQRIESILGQTYRDFELMILDDASTDDSREVIDRYTGDSRVKTIYNGTNVGSPYRQWKLGLSHAQGDYAWIAESDDSAELTLLESLVDRLDHNPQVGMAACESRFIDEDGQIMNLGLETMKSNPDYAAYDFSFWDRDFVLPGREFCLKYMYPRNTLHNASAIVFRRATLLAAGGPVLDMVLCADWLTYVNVLMISDIAYVPEPLNLFRQHHANVRTRTSPAVYFRESMFVARTIGDRLGLTAGRRKEHENIRHCVQGLLSRERQPPDRKVPWRRTVPLLWQANRFGPRSFGTALRILAWERAAELTRRLGLLGLARRLMKGAAATQRR